MRLNKVCNILTASDQSSFSDKSDLNGTDNLTVIEVIDAECSENESDEVQFTTASIALGDSSATSIFTCEDMTNYIGQRKQFVDNCGPQNETHCAEVFKMFLMMKWWNY
jgi:hypothetical protein